MWTSATGDEQGNKASKINTTRRNRYQFFTFTIVQMDRKKIKSIVSYFIRKSFSELINHRADDSFGEKTFYFYFFNPTDKCFFLDKSSPIVFCLQFPRSSIATSAVTPHNRFNFFPCSSAGRCTRLLYDNFSFHYWAMTI